LTMIKKALQRKRKKRRKKKSKLTLPTKKWIQAAWRLKSARMLLSKILQNTASCLPLWTRSYGRLNANRDSKGNW